MPITDPQPRATLHERIERDRLERHVSSAEEPGSGTIRIASLIAAAKARVNKSA